MAQFMLVSGMVAFSEALCFQIQEGRVAAGNGRDQEMGSEGNRLLVYRKCPVQRDTRSARSTSILI